jgi:glutathione S-transferase
MEGKNADFFEVFSRQSAVLAALRIERHTISRAYRRKKSAMTYTLYYSPGTASMAVHWMLIELGVAFEARLVDVDAGAQRSAEYLRMNPAGRVPTLVIDGIPHAESAALLMLLAERHPAAALAPLPGSPFRAAWLEMMIYLANTLLPAMRDWFYAEKDGDPTGADAVRALARRRIEGTWDRLDAHLADGRTHLVGGQVSTADLLAVMLMRWSRNMPRPALTWKNLTPYIHRMRSLPSFVEVNRREGLTDWQN